MHVTADGLLVYYLKMRIKQYKSSNTVYPRCRSRLHKTNTRARIHAQTFISQLQSPLQSQLPTSGTNMYDNSCIAGTLCSHRTSLTLHPVERAIYWRDVPPPYQEFSLSPSVKAKKSQPLAPNSLALDA